MSVRATRTNPLLTVKDINSSVKFYEDILGFEKNEVIKEGGNLRYVDFIIGTSVLMLAPESSRSYDAGQNYKTHPKGIGVELYVDIEDDIKDLRQKLKEKKIRFVKGLHETPWGTYQFHIADPDGYILIFSKPK